jgi:hypothetical protein
MTLNECMLARAMTKKTWNGTWNVAPAKRAESHPGKHPAAISRVSDANVAETRGHLPRGEIGRAIPRLGNKKDADRGRERDRGFPARTWHF